MQNSCAVSLFPVGQPCLLCLVHICLFWVYMCICVCACMYTCVYACAFVGYTQELFSPTVWKPQQQAPLPTHLDGPSFSKSVEIVISRTITLWQLSRTEFQSQSEHWRCGFYCTTFQLHIKAYPTWAELVN